MNAIETRKKAHQWLIGAAMLHVLSYVSPMGLGTDGWSYFWGGVLVKELFYNLLEPMLWAEVGYIVIGVSIPFLVLLYTSVVFLRKRNGHRQLPSRSVLVLGWLLPNGLLGTLVLCFWLTGIHHIPPMLGYGVWNASFWGLFWGLERYRKSLVSPSKDWMEHLIDD